MTVFAGGGVEAVEPLRSHYLYWMAQFVAGVNDKTRDWVIERARKAGPAIPLSLLRDYSSINFGMLFTGPGATVPIRALNLSPTKIDVANRLTPDFDAVIMQGVGHFPHLVRRSNPMRLRARCWRFSSSSRGLDAPEPDPLPKTPPAFR